MVKYQYEKVGAPLGDQTDNWLVFSAEDGVTNHTALCATETIAQSVTDTMNGRHHNLHENIAAIATNFACSDAFGKACDDNLAGDGWIGIMRQIVRYAEAFTSQEAEHGTFDWYLAIDEFSDLIAKYVLTDDDMAIDPATLAAMARNSILNNSSSPPPKPVQIGWQWVDNRHGGMGWFTNEQKVERETKQADTFKGGYWRQLDPEEIKTMRATIKALTHEQSLPDSLC